jgi:MFS family permease
MRSIAENLQEQPWPPIARGWWAVSVFAAATILSYTDRLVVSLLVDPIRADLSISETEISYVQGIAFALIYGFAGIPLGRLADLVMRRWLLVAGVAIWSAGTVACGLAQGFSELFVARIFVGIGEAALAPAAVSIIGDYFPPHRRGTAIGVFVMAMVIGGGSAFAVGGWLYEAASQGAFAFLPGTGELAPWRLTFILLGFPGLIVILLVLSIHEPKRRTDGPDAAQTWPLKKVIGEFRRRRRILLPLYAAMAIATIVDFSLLSWTPALLTRRFGYTPAEAGAMLGSISVLAGIVGVISAGALSDRWARTAGVRARLTFAFGACCAGVLGTTIGFSETGVQSAVCFAIWSLMTVSISTVGISAVQDMMPAALRGLSMSFISFGNIVLGLSLGPTLTAMATEHVFQDPKAVGWAITLVSAPAALLATILFGITLARVRESDPDRAVAPAIPPTVR